MWLFPVYGAIPLLYVTLVKTYQNTDKLRYKVMSITYFYLIGGQMGFDIQMSSEIYHFNTYTGKTCNSLNAKSQS
jgi:hypothetical protein